MVTPADRASFHRCRRQWDLGARCRRNLEPAGRPAVPGLEGALREALAVYYFPGMWDWDRSVTLPLVIQGFDRAMDRQREMSWTAPDAGAWQEQRDAGRRLLTRYFAWAPDVDWFSPVLVDAAYEVNVPRPDEPMAGLVTATGAPVRYRGRIDMLAVDSHDAYWIVRHSLVDGAWPLTGQLPAESEPLTACWAWEQFYLGMAIEGIIYNELRLYPQPDPPAGRGDAAAPATRRRGWLRARRAEGAQRYVRQHEPSGGGRSIPQHRRMYAVASRPEHADTIEQRAGEYFRRTWLRQSRAEVAAAGGRLAGDAAEMAAGPAIYPDPSVANCPPCEFLDPCLAIFAGHDAEAVITSSYRERPPDVPQEGRLGGGAWGMGRGAAPPRFRGR